MAIRSLTIRQRFLANSFLAGLVGIVVGWKVVAAATGLGGQIISPGARTPAHCREEPTPVKEHPDSPGPPESRCGD